MKFEFRKPPPELEKIVGVDVVEVVMGMEPELKPWIARPELLIFVRKYFSFAKSITFAISNFK